MDKTVKLIKDIIKLDAITLLILSGVTSLFYEDKSSVFLGYLFGGLVGILAFILLARTLQKASVMSPQMANKYARNQYFVRMIIYAAVILVGIEADYLNTVTVVIGLLSIKFVIYFKEVFFNKKFMKKIFRRKEDN